MFSELETIKYCLFLRSQMVNVAQLVRAPDCGSGGRRFKPGLSPMKMLPRSGSIFFLSILNRNVKTKIYYYGRPQITQSTIISSKYCCQKSTVYEVLVIPSPCFPQ